MKRDRFFQDGLACDIFLNDSCGAESAGVGIYLYGFPGSIGENEITQKLLGLGLVVIQPHFPGTYDSAGLFTPLAAMGMFRTIAKAMESGVVTSVKNGKSISLPTGPTVCVAHSFGCFPALRAAGDCPNLKVLVLLGPAIAYGVGTTGCGLEENGTEHIAYVKRSRPFTFRLGLDKEWLSLYAGEMDMVTPQDVPAMKLVLGLVGEKDPYFQLEVLKSRFQPLVRNHIGNAADVRLCVVSDAAHGPKGLLRDNDIEEIASII